LILYGINLLEADMTRPSAAPKRPQDANQGEVNQNDAAVLLETPFGHEDDQGAEPGSIAEDEVRRPAGGRPRSEITGVHDDGAGANETEDGLDGYAESARQEAEDVAVGEDRPDTPVFDRSDAPPKL
jgi:hypothetical protein